MYLVDFIFDGIKLSDLGCMVGSIVTGVENSVEMGSVINFETKVNHGSYITEIVNATYNDVYTCTFDIFRKPCSNFQDSLSDKEVSWFMRWLNRKEYCKFTPIYDDNHSFHGIYMMGTFNEIKAISIGGNVVGFTLTLITNAPFAFLDYKPFKYSNVNKLTMIDESEEIGVLYPKNFKIKCLSSGNFVMTNTLDKEHDVKINNCTLGEIITFDCIHKVITSTGHNKLYNDFNYNFPRLVNSLNDKKNIFEFSFNCDVEVEYNPIRKVGVV